MQRQISIENCATGLYYVGVMCESVYKGGRSHCIYIYAHLVPFAALIKIAVALS